MVSEKDFLEENQNDLELVERSTSGQFAIEQKEENILESENSRIELSVEKSEKNVAIVTEAPKWFSLRVISGKEKKIKERIELEIERSGWKDIVLQIVVPTEKVFKMKNGKKVMQERNLLPGYILVEAISSKLNGEVAKAINDTQNVIHFLGKEHPIPMTTSEAHRLLGIVDDQVESGGSLIEPFLVGEPVKIIDGPFSDFIGEIQKIDDEKKKLTVIVKIFGRGTQMELNYMQVEKIS